MSLIDLVQTILIVGLIAYSVQLTRVVIHQKRLIDLAFDSADLAMDRGKINSEFADKLYEWIKPS